MKDTLNPNEWIVMEALWAKSPATPSKPRTDRGAADMRRKGVEHTIFWRYEPLCHR